MKSFSERHGFSKPEKLQREGAGKGLRNGLSNAVYEELTDPHASIYEISQLVRCIWCDVFRQRVDQIPSAENLPGLLVDYFAKCEWHELYSTVEAIGLLFDSIRVGPVGQRFRKECNRVLTRENSAYRFNGSHIVPITSEGEIEEIESALNTPYRQINVQIESALRKLSEKPMPDARNCIKEAIGAVETTVKVIDGSGKGTLGGLIKKIQDRLNLHPALADGLNKIYGYTGDDKSGIRHGMMDKSNLDTDDARFMLVSCAAFVNYLLSLARRSGLITQSPENE